MQEVDTDLFLPEAELPHLCRVYGAVQQLKSSFLIWSTDIVSVGVRFPVEAVPADWGANTKKKKWTDIKIKQVV